MNLWMWVKVDLNEVKLNWRSQSEYDLIYSIYEDCEIRMIAWILSNVFK